MDSTTIIQTAAGIIFLAILVMYIVFIASLAGAFTRRSITSRTMTPGMVWLMLVPLLNLIGPFLVVSRLSESLANEFRARGVLNVELQPGKSIGIAMCICACCGIIPLVNILALPAHLVLVVIYWVKIAKF